MEQHKQNIARLLESDLQNAPLAYNLAVSVGLKEWFLGWFRGHEKVKPIVDFVLVKWAYVDHSIIDYDRFVRPTDQYLVDIVLDAQSDYLGLVKLMEIEEFKRFAMLAYSQTIRAKIDASPGGIMYDNINFISENAPTGEFVITQNILKVQKRLSHASR